MFDLRQFVKGAIMRMIGNDPTYRVMEYALGWYSKSVLADGDMVEIQAAIEAYEESLLPEVFPEVEEVAEMIEVFEEEPEDAVE